MICLVSVLSCLGCMGTGTTRLESGSGRRPTDAPEGLVKTAGYRIAKTNQPLPIDLDKLIESELLEASPQDSVAEPDVPLTATDAVQLNLPTVLSMIDTQHPAVGLAQWRVQQAYARLDRAKVLWLPSIRAGFSFNRHDGNLQASDGGIVDVNRNAFHYGLGVGATGAGTTMLPGLEARFHLADAIFQPKIARDAVAARTHAATAMLNQQLLSAAIAYLDLLEAHQDVRIVEETRDRTSDLLKLTSDFAAAGTGLQADADRMATELALVEDRVMSTRERIEVAQARLAEAISAEGGVTILPLDPTAVPIELASPGTDKAQLIRTGLANRPELREAQALVAEACQQHRRQKCAPFVPSVLLGFSTGGFGGGLGNQLDNVDSRYDFDAVVAWELRNFGMGELAARRDANARVQQNRYAQIQTMDRVARQIAQAHAEVVHRAQRIAINSSAIQKAEDSYQRNLSRIRDGQGLPLEALQSLRALEDARRAYLNAVTQYNQSQFTLQWSLGWPVNVPGG